MKNRFRYKVSRRTRIQKALDRCKLASLLSSLTQAQMDSLPKRIAELERGLAREAK